MDTTDTTTYTMLTKYISTFGNGDIIKQHSTRASVISHVLSTVDGSTMWTSSDVYVLKVEFPADDPTMWEITPMTIEQVIENS